MRHGGGARRLRLTGAFLSLATARVLGERRFAKCCARLFQLAACHAFESVACMRRDLYCIEFFDVIPLGCVIIGLCVSLPGCGGGGGDVKSDSEGKSRITQLFRLYKAYVERNKKGPANEQALHDFGAKLTAEERASYLIGDDIEGLFTSPRDKQKYVIRYNEKLEPTGPSRG